MKREHQIHFWYVILALLAVVAIRDMMATPDHVRTIPYSEVRRLATEGELTDLVVGTDRITGAFREVTLGRLVAPSLALLALGLTAVALASTGTAGFLAVAVVAESAGIVGPVMGFFASLAGGSGEERLSGARARQPGWGIRSGLAPPECSPRFRADRTSPSPPRLSSRSPRLFRSPAVFSDWQRSSLTPSDPRHATRPTDRT